MIMRMMNAIVRQITMNINFCEQNTRLPSLGERIKTYPRRKRRERKARSERPGVRASGPSWSGERADPLDLLEETLPIAKADGNSKGTRTRANRPLVRPFLDLAILARSFRGRVGERCCAPHPQSFPRVSRTSSWLTGYRWLMSHGSRTSSLFRC